jgi:predicted TIM-barrel fold metal-dependent hydrolase
VNIPMLDCHQHLIYPDKYPYSWTDTIPQLAGRAFTYEDYLNLIGGRGEIRAIFMESAPDDPHWTSESRFVAGLAEADDTLIDGLILNCRPESEEDFDGYIESVSHPKLVGLRRILHVMPDDTSQQARFVSNVKKLEHHNLTFDLCFLSRQLPLAYQLACSGPNVQFVLDHCGVPDIAGGALDPWRQDISKLAELPNVDCKISGVLAYCSPQDTTLKAIQPYIEHCLETFGWNRVVWGSDWPLVCMTSNLPDWIDVIRELVSSETEDNQHKLFHRNAERIYLNHS